MGSRMTGAPIFLCLVVACCRSEGAEGAQPRAGVVSELGGAAGTGDDAFTPAQAPAPATPGPAVTPPSRAAAPAVRVPAATAPVLPRAAPAPAPPALPPDMFTAASSGATAPSYGSVPPGDRFGTLGGFSSGGIFQMIGDQGPGIVFKQIPTTPRAPGLPTPFPPGRLPRPPSPGTASALGPSVRGFKIAENQSPRPQDRFFYSFNFYADLNGTINKRLDAPVNNLRAYREIFGFEKTFDSGNGSIGLRLPLNTLTANSSISGKFNKPGGTSTAVGDLGIFAKYILKADPRSGSLISVGLLITAPTGPSSFAGAHYLQSFHDTSIQPFLGYIWNRGDFYLQGFSAVDMPSLSRDVSMIYNDLGIGYYLFRNPDPTRFLTAIAPTFETHVNTPLTHRDPLNTADPAGTYDVVNLTAGVNVEFYRRGVLTFGFVTPVTGPKPFAYEALLLFNLYFGGPQRPAFPVLGG